MFEFVRNIISGVKQMIDRTTIKRILNEPPELTERMVEKIDQWRDMLDGHAFWCVDYVKSLRIEQGICREFADVTLTEMEVRITNERLLRLFKSCTEDLNEYMQEGLALGSFCLKPLGNGQAEFVSADKFVPISFGNDKKPNDIVFFDFRQMDTSKWYVRLERHSIKQGFLEITNTAYASSSRQGFDRIVSLDVLSEWAGLPESAAYPGMPMMDFGYYRNPIKNSIDETSCGVSIFEAAAGMIERADRQCARLDWEFESGERAVHVDPAALRKQTDGSIRSDKLNHRLYRSLNVERKDGQGMYDVFSPEFRDQSIINGLEKYYRQIEFAVGLAYGDLSDTQIVDKTATEIKAAKQRKYNRVHAIQSNLKDCLNDFTAGLAFHEGMLTSGYEFVCNFKDSIMTSEEEERQLMLSEIAAGIRAPWEYRMRFLGEDEATAKKNLPNWSVDQTLNSQFVADGYTPKTT